MTMGSSIDRISLRDWVNVTLDSISLSENDNPLISTFALDGDQRTLALSSDNYILSALKVARSLADQICNAQEQENVGSNEKLVRGKCTPLPTPGVDWAENVTVHLSPPNGQYYDDEDKDIQPLLFSPEKSPSAYPEELQSMLQSVIGNDVSLLEKEGKEEEEVERYRPHYFSIAGAEIISDPSSVGKDGCYQELDEMRLIHSLGLVFYEIFSGGDKPSDKYIDATNDIQEPELLLEDREQLQLLSTKQADSIDITNNLNLGDDTIFDFDSLHEEEPAPKRKLAPDKKMCLVLVEPLKSKGVPWPLCELIANMIDCAHGDLSGDETYHHMDAVRSDLQRMLDKPRTYLDDLDIAKLSVTGLELNKTSFGRDEEFAMLKGSYRRSISGESELAIISGSSGVGKSVLAHRLGSFITTGGGIFLHGKFDQLQQAVPFSALSSAFSQYCDMLANEENTEHSVKVINELIRVLGNDIYHLARVIPTLLNLIGQNGSQQSMDWGCVDAQKKLQYLMCQFIGVISSSGVPVTLFLDDLQWAGGSSINAITQLLLVSSCGSFNFESQFFFFGGVRDNEVAEGHPLVSMLSGVGHFGLVVKTISLKCMDEDTVNEVLSNALCLSPRLTRPLSHTVHHKTKGNPLFFSQLLISLIRDKLLRLSLNRRRWVWDEENIQSRKMPDDVAAFIISSLGRLSQEVQASLSLLSCFGASATTYLLQTLASQLNMPLMESFEQAVTEGILDKVNGSYSFSHDKVQEAAYSMLRENERCLFHFKYGVVLIAHYLKTNDETMVFTATDQLNRGGPAAVEETRQYVQIARLNLTAGLKAMDMSDFTSAFSYFDHGISFLRKKHWQEQYDLSLALYENAAKCASFLGNMVSFTYLSQQLFSCAKSFEDQLEVLFLTVNSVARVNIPEAINKALSVLNTLGEEFAESYSESDTKLIIEETKRSLDQFTGDTLLFHKPMTDRSKIMTMKFLSRLELIFLFAKPSFVPIVTVKHIQLSMRHGLSPQAPLGFVYFGMHVSRLGNVSKGYDYAKFGMQLSKKEGYNEVAGESIGIGTHVTCFVEPLQSAVETFLEGHDAAMAAGDMSNAMMCKLSNAVVSVWAGENLTIAKEKFRECRTMMVKQNNLMFLSHLTPPETTVLTLMGTTESELPGEPNTGGSSAHASLLSDFNKLFLSYLFRDFDETKKYAVKYFDYDLTSWTLLYIHSFQEFIGGLVSYRLFRQTRDPIWAERASRAKRAMKKWADSSEWNFSHKLLLLEAEEAFSNNDAVNAKTLYEKAATLAKEHRFINEAAMAYELCGYFYLELGNKDTAIQYFMQSHEAYHEWGAVEKSNALFAFVQQTLGPTVSQLSTGLENGR